MAEQGGVTAELSRRAAGLRFDDISEDARRVAGQCLLDWFGVTIAGSREPLVEILWADLQEDGGEQQVSVIGRSKKMSVTQGALLNGAMSHALDFDDVNLVMMGHATVPVAPVVLALSEFKNLNGKRLIEGIVAGIEAECCIGRFVGSSHYRRGWHNTATLGTFGAAAAACNLLRLSDDAAAHAFGIAGTQAAGLKSVFGTMCKPFHAGHAAAAGLQAARLATRGFTSHPSILETKQGFGATQSDHVDPEKALAEPPGGFHIVQTLFKYHAACYFTHSPIEAMNALSKSHQFSINDIAHVDLGLFEGNLSVCNIEEPSTGLEIKFSLRATSALALLGEDTADEALYSDATAAREDVQALSRKVAVRAIPTKSDTYCRVVLRTQDGREFQQEFDVGVPLDDLDQQEKQLRNKFLKLATPAVGQARAREIADICLHLDQLGNAAELMDLVRQ